MPRIQIDIAPDGSTKVTAQGYSGKSCTDATRAIREALGEQTGEKRTSEYYQETRGIARNQVENRQ